MIWGERGKDNEVVNLDQDGNYNIIMMDLDISLSIEIETQLLDEDKFYLEMMSFKQLSRIFISIFLIF